MKQTTPSSSHPSFLSGDNTTGAGTGRGDHVNAPPELADKDIYLNAAHRPEPDARIARPQSQEAQY